MATPAPPLSAARGGRMCDRQRLAPLYVIVNLSKRCDLQHSLMTTPRVFAGLHYLIADRVLPSSERVVTPSKLAPNRSNQTVWSGSLCHGRRRHDCAARACRWAAIRRVATLARGSALVLRL